MRADRPFAPVRPTLGGPAASRESRRSMPSELCSGASVSEEEIRSALRTRLGRAQKSAELVSEFWIPVTNERADVALLGKRLEAFEIKTHHDSLNRLPRQAASFAKVFDRCTLVTDRCHLEGARKTVVPGWWGLTTFDAVQGRITFDEIRRPRPNPEIDREVLVRLLWKSEAHDVLLVLGASPSRSDSRTSMWGDILRLAGPRQLPGLVRKTLRNRDPSTARIATRRFMGESA